MEHQNPSQAREQILSAVRAYAGQQNAPGSGEPRRRIPYAGRVYDQEEMVNLVDSALEFWLTSGRYTEQFEQELSGYLGVSYCSFVNSGSSANLLAFSALTAPELGERQIRRGDEVITVACGFPTTVAPILQYGAVPVFVDIQIPTYNVAVSTLENACSKKTKAVILAHTLGNPFDLRAVKDFCRRHNLWLVEDNCDALGAEFYMDGACRKTGTIGDIGTSSFYPAHHITTGEGGAVYTNDQELHRIIRSMRDWGRACVCPSGRDNVCGHRFDGQFGTLPAGYDHKYVYNHLGYNLKATDMQAAIGVAQLKKLPDFIVRRNANFSKLQAGLAHLSGRLIFPEVFENAKPSWFGFPITCACPGQRGRIVRALEQAGIQTRMLFAGNLVRHPCFDSIREEPGAFRVSGTLTNTDRVVDDTFWIGVYPGLSDQDIGYMINSLEKAVNKL